MKFLSTHGNYEVTSFSKAIMTGFCPDGGLLMPEDLPPLTENILNSWSHLSYPTLLTKFLQLIVNKSDPVYEYLQDIELETFKKFKKEMIPIKKCSNFSVVELFHGPTLAFKDYAMFPLAFLIDKAIKYKVLCPSEAVIKKQNLLIATTGDTGSSALEATRPFVDNINTFVLFPKERVTDIQRLQMITADASNGFAIECAGNCDDIEAYIRDVNSDDEFCDYYNISCLNSLNCGRIICQITLHIYTYLKVAKNVGDVINIAIPCGGWGNLISACLAQSMGLPIKIILCNNENDFGYQMIKYGVLQKQKESHFSWSSAMDTALPYNLPRLLWIYSDHNTDFIRSTLNRVSNNEKVFLPETFMKKMRSVIIDSAAVNCYDTIEAMTKCYQEEKYYLCPHTATAVSYYYKNEVGNENKNVVISTASVEKFNTAAIRADIFKYSEKDSLLGSLKRKKTAYTIMDYEESPVLFLKNFIVSKND